MRNACLNLENERIWQVFPEKLYYVILIAYKMEIYKELLISITTINVRKNNYSTKIEKDRKINLFCIKLIRDPWQKF